VLTSCHLSIHQRRYFSAENNKDLQHDSKRCGSEKRIVVLGLNGLE
jgi:hypothetical protein